ncbi:MAG: lantibiotic dehydratase, partial [Acidobacteriota bacterium]
FAAIGDASVERGRRLLLKTKRACFNGRPMRRLRDHEDWDVVEAAGGAPIVEALAAESELAELWSRFERDFATRTREEDGELARWSTDPFFRCGLAVASPTVARESHRLTQRPAEAFGRRERRLRPTLLRYISRAAFKLSPFSTFTPVARAVYDEHVGPAGYDLGGEPIQHRSMVRLRRHLLDRAMALLERYEPLRRTLGVQLNDSEYRTPDGQSCHVRPSQWFVDETARRFAYREPSIVKLDGGAALFVELRRHVVDRPSYERLVERLAASDLATDDGGPREAQARGVIDQLLDIGWLVFEPWLDSDADHLEADLLAGLRTRFSRLSDRHLRTFVDHLDRLVELQNGLLDAEHPDRSCREIESLIDALFASGGELAGLDGFDVTHRNSEHDLYQDVWRVTPDLPRFDHTTARALFDDARPLVRYARLFDHRVELLRTIGEVCRGSGSEPLPLLDAFDRSRSLFTDYMKFFVHDGRSEGFDSTWNPLDLTDLGELARHRQIATGALDACSTTVEGEG